MNRQSLQPALLAILVACADWLLYDGGWGISVALFLILVTAAIALGDSGRAPRRSLIIAAGWVAASLLPLIENAGGIAVLLSTLAVAHFALMVNGKVIGSITERVRAALDLVFTGPFRCCLRLVLSFEGKLQSDTMRGMGTALMGWTVPTVFCAIFLLLFIAANPILENWFADIRVADALVLIDPVRFTFWLTMAAIVSPFLFAPESHTISSAPEIGAPEPPLMPEWVGSDATVLRSLAAFNLLFALQTAMDIQYLWRGTGLPEGMSYADYAHRGAYPLLATALLAGGFVIVAMKPGCPRERSPLMRGLVFAWTAQNVLLVLSAMLRLKIYVDTYSLTYWRSAAFIWMFLVATGLVLIVFRIAFNRSNVWLVTANLTVLCATLYLCGFVNFPAMVATYNVDHSIGLSGTGETLDLCYLSELGPQAIPAIDRYIARRGASAVASLDQDRQNLAATFRKTMDDWRRWSFRDWRLARYLKNHA